MHAAAAGLSHSRHARLARGAGPQLASRCTRARTLLCVTRTASLAGCAASRLAGRGPARASAPRGAARADRRDVDAGGSTVLHPPTAPPTRTPYPPPCSGCSAASSTRSSFTWRSACGVLAANLTPKFRRNRNEHTHAGTDTLTIGLLAQICSSRAALPRCCAPRSRSSCCVSRACWPRRM